MGEPPFSSGAIKLTVALRLPVAVATIDVGAPGAPTVVTELEALEAAEVPAELVAVTVNVYEVPAVKPVIEIVPLPACEIDPVIPPGVEVAIYEVIVAPPSEAGAVKETFAVVAPVDVAVTEVGASGAVVGDDVVIELDGLDGEEVAKIVEAVTVKLYVVPGVKPEIFIVPPVDCDNVPVRPPGDEVAV